MFKSRWGLAVVVGPVTKRGVVPQPLPERAKDGLRNLGSLTTFWLPGGGLKRQPPQYILLSVFREKSGLTWEGLDVSHETADRTILKAYLERVWLHGCEAIVRPTVQPRPIGIPLREPRKGWWSVGIFDLGCKHWENVSSPFSSILLGCLSFLSVRRLDKHWQ